MTRTIAWINCLLPLFAVTASYAISYSQGLVEGCVPFWHGCTSISRAARSGDAIFLFRGVMMPLVPVYLAYWWLQTRWLATLSTRRREITTIFWLGCVSALALILYVDFLGADGSFARLMRRQGVMLYFGLAGIAQLLSLHVLHKARIQLTEPQRLAWQIQWFAVGVQWVLGLGSILNSALQPENRTEINNALEWSFALTMVAFYAGSALAWRQFQINIKI